jgi:hypothetical protein
MHDNGIKHRIYHEKVCDQCDYQGALCDDKELEAEIESTVASGERMAPRINIPSRKW